MKANTNISISRRNVKNVLLAAEFLLSVEQQGYANLLANEIRRLVEFGDLVDEKNSPNSSALLRAPIQVKLEIPSNLDDDGRYESLPISGQEGKAKAKQAATVDSAQSDGLQLIRRPPLTEPITDPLAAIKDYLEWYNPMPTFNEATSIH